MKIYQWIEALLQYGIDKQLIMESDRIFARNQLLNHLHLESWEDVENIPEGDLYQIIDQLMDEAAQLGLLESNTPVYRDLLDTALLGVITPWPSQVINRFNGLAVIDKQAATNYFYQLSQDVNYIRMDRIKKNQHFYANSEYGDLEITINLSKPEKDPKAIAAAKDLPQSSYPKCLLCKENTGYAGRLNHPARQNLRTIPLTLNNEPWSFQYSPYIYYNEHSIIFNDQHTPMSINRATFVKLIDFIDWMPHYFIGSNADLPIVGGSILSHDHFQGGKHQFPMEKAQNEESYTVAGYENVTVSRVKWPMSVIRLNSDDKIALINLADHILHKWIDYSDSSVAINAYTQSVRHNTITPIGRRRGDLYELDLVLRNNRTSEEHPDGIFHPHAELHHIKKENIGLIEVMGLAVLPPRLIEELEMIKQCIIKKQPNQSYEEIPHHYDWMNELRERYVENDDIDQFIEKELGQKFANVLEHAGVFKRNHTGIEAFSRFIQSL